MSFTQELGAPFWFPDSILLAALLLRPRKEWWLLILAPLPIRLWTSVPPDASLWFLLGVYANDSLKGLISAWLLDRPPDRQHWFDDLREYAKYFLVAVVSIPALSAFAGAAARTAIGYGFWSTWKTWFLGNSLTHLVLTPAAICLVREYKGLIRRNLWNYVEAVLNGAGLAIVSYLSFFSE